MAGFLKNKFNKPLAPATAVETKAEEVVKPTLGGLNKPGLGKGKLGGLGTLNKPKLAEPEEIKLEPVNEVVAETPVEEKVAPLTPQNKPKLGGFGLKKTPKTEVVEPEVVKEVEEAIVEAEQEVPVEVNLESQKAETPVAEEKPKKRSRASRKKTTETVVNSTVATPEVDESKRVSIEEMDGVMKEIVAPTTEAWEQEKKDVLAALNNIKVEQDMGMTQVKHALAELDDLKFEILPRQHEAETLFDGTKKNYEMVKSIAISQGKGTNAEERKAEGILACKNYVTPGGEVVDLNVYMLLIEERNKFYQKVVDGIDFKKYSLLNYNNALKVESRDV